MNGYSFSENVRDALAQARREAAHLEHGLVGSEHILLAIIGRPDNIAASLLDVGDVGPDVVRARILSIVKSERRGGDERDLPYSSRGKRVLELAMSEARELNADSVTTGHLFLGIIREERGIGASVLADFGFTIDAVRMRLIELVQKGRSEPVTTVQRDSLSAFASTEMNPLQAAALLSTMLQSPRIAPIFARHNIDAAALIRDLVAEQKRS